MLLTRDYDFRRDAEVVNKIWIEHHSNDFGIPSFDHTIIRRVVEVDDRVIAYGFAKLNPEATMILDLSQSKRTKVLALQALLFDAIKDCKKLGFNQLNAVVKNNPEYLKLLRKHYGFKDTNGTMVVMEID